ncbi:MAG: phasin family protein [Anaerolineae bacterium]|nr:phasin family protein [Anaerolineae bacterium]
MATKKLELREPNRVFAFTRKVALAYVGAFGVVGDELGKLFEQFVHRGEKMQHDMGKLVKRNDKQVRHLTQQLKKEQKIATAKANKAVKKAVKRVEHAIA